MKTPSCWWCCHSFEWEALHWPYKFKSNIFSTTGYFCNWSCMKAYAFDKGRTDTYEFIVLMKKRKEGSIGSEIKRAPKKECLEMFGGTITIDEFRQFKKPIHVYIPNEIFQLQIISNTNLMVNTPASTSELQLKRVKPLERSKGRLETVLTKCSNAAKKEKKNDSNLNMDQK